MHTHLAHRVIGRRPRVRAIAQTPRGERVQHALVRILLRAEKDEVLEAVRAPVVRVRFGGERKVAIDQRREAVGENDAQTCGGAIEGGAQTYGNN